MKIWVGQKVYLGFFCKKTPNELFGQPILTTVSGISSPPYPAPTKNSTEMSKWYDTELSRDSQLALLTAVIHSLSASPPPSKWEDKSEHLALPLQ